MAETQQVQNGVRLPLTYKVHMTMDWFKDVYREQNRAYNRKIGIMCLVLFTPLTLVSIYFVLSDPEGAGTEGLGAVVLFAAMAVLGGLMTTGKPVMMRTRKGELSGFFANHGMPDPHGPYSLDDLKCDYDVSVEQDGFAETVTLANGLKMITRRPWVSLTGKGGDAAGGYTFAADDGKNSSIWYNMLGINGLIREGLEASPFVVPREVEDANPGLVPWISAAISAQREDLKRGTKAQRRDAVAAWTGYDAILPDGRKANPEDPKDLAEVERLIGE